MVLIEASYEGKHTLVCLKWTENLRCESTPRPKILLQILQYLLLHLHVFKDGVHPPRLGKHGAESGCVSNDEDPGPDLSE